MLEVERGERLDRAGLEAAASDHREVGGSLRQGEGHHAPHLRRRRQRQQLTAAGAGLYLPRSISHLKEDAMKPHKLLSLDAVEAIYSGAIIALHGVDLLLEQGKILALLGANGAGKTTTLKAISNLLPAERGQVTAGSISFDGLDVTRTRTSDLVRPVLFRCWKAVIASVRLASRRTSSPADSGGRARGRNRCRYRTDLWLLPAAGRKAKDTCWPDLWRRTADDCHWPRTHVEAAPPGARRAVHGTGSAGRGSDL